MANTLEVEGKEILIKSSKGVMAVIPKNMADWVRDQIAAGKHDVVDKYVNSLEEYKYENNNKEKQMAGNGLYANIHAKRERIAAGSGERMRKPGEPGAPTADQFKQAAKTAKAEDGMLINPQDPPTKAIAPASSTAVVRPDIPELAKSNSSISFLQPKAQENKAIPTLWEKYSNNGKDRTLLETIVNFLPRIEQAVDVKDMVAGAVTGDREQMNSGVIGMAAPIAGKAVLTTMDYATEKGLGRDVAEANAMKRKELVNMTDNERMALFKKYGYGGYDKWVRAGRPDLSK